jgi:hypothetical protein
MPPQSEESKEQSTSATANLSAGSVAGAIGHLPDGEPSASAGSEHEDARRSTVITTAKQRLSHMTPRPRTVGVGAGVLLAGAAVAGAWLYRRRQVEQSRPINRFRRGAREAASRVGGRLTAVEKLPRSAAPVGGAATAVVLLALVLAIARALPRAEREPNTRTTQAKAALSELAAIARQRERVLPSKAELQQATRALTTLRTAALDELRAVSRRQAERLPGRPGGDRRSDGH